MLHTLYKETPSPLNPLGVKGVGEAGTIPAAAAIVSAIEDALSPFNVRIGHYPVTPMQIIEMIQAGGAAALRSPDGAKRHPGPVMPQG
jgi:carbon-monoxide dehydrogenase large subunit